VADRDGANQCAPPLDVPSMEGLGHSLMALLNAALRATPLGANLLSICLTRENQFEYAPRHETTIALAPAWGTLRRCKRREADAFKRRETDLRWCAWCCRFEPGVAREQEKASARGRREPKCIEVFCPWERGGSERSGEGEHAKPSKAVVHGGN